MNDILDLQKLVSDRANRGQSGDGEIMPDRRSAQRKRLHIEISPELHKRILGICATRGIPVNQAVREVLERTFPG